MPGCTDAGRAALVTPASPSSDGGDLLLPLALLFRYSLNAFVPGQFMVEALTPANYVNFFTDSFYRRCCGDGADRGAGDAICLVPASRRPTCWRGPAPGEKPADHGGGAAAFVGNAVRAAGWMVAFGARARSMPRCCGLGLIARPIDIMFTETCRGHRHHRGEPAVHGADLQA